MIGKIYIHHFVRSRYLCEFEGGGLFTRFEGFLMLNNSEGKDQVEWEAPVLHVAELNPAGLKSLSNNENSQHRVVAS